MLFVLFTLKYGTFHFVEKHFRRSICKHRFRKTILTNDEFGKKKKEIYTFKNCFHREKCNGFQVSFTLITINVEITNYYYYFNTNVEK